MSLRSRVIGFDTTVEDGETWIMIRTIIEDQQIQCLRLRKTNCSVIAGGLLGDC